MMKEPQQSMIPKYYKVINYEGHEFCMTFNYIDNAMLLLLLALIKLDHPEINTLLKAFEVQVIDVKGRQYYPNKSAPVRVFKAKKPVVKKSNEQPTDLLEEKDLIQEIKLELFRLIKNEAQDMDVVGWLTAIDNCFENNNFYERDTGNLRWRLSALQHKKFDIRRLLEFITTLMKKRRLVNEVGEWVGSENGGKV